MPRYGTGDQIVTSVISSKFLPGALNRICRCIIDRPSDPVRVPDTHRIWITCRGVPSSQISKIQESGRPVIQAKGKTGPYQYYVHRIMLMVQNQVFPLLPFPVSNAQSAFNPSRSFWFHPWKNADAFMGFFRRRCWNLFYSGTLWVYNLIYIYIGYVNGIFYQVLL